MATQGGLQALASRKREAGGEHVHVPASASAAVRCRPQLGIGASLLASMASLARRSAALNDVAWTGAANGEGTRRR